MPSTGLQAASVILDPHANAFSHNASTSGSQDHQNDARKPKSAPAAFEGKYEIDSLASVLKLCPTSPYWYSRLAEGGLSAFPPRRTLLHEARPWGGPLTSSRPCCRVQPGGRGRIPYLFQREASRSTDTLSMSMQGRGPSGNHRGAWAGSCSGPATMRSPCPQVAWQRLRVVGTGPNRTCSLPWVGAGARRPKS